MSTPNVAEPEAVNFETSFHLDRDVENPDNYLVIHELMGRGQLLNAYEVRPHHPQKNRTTTSISTSPPRVRGSRSRSPARAKTFPATRSSRHFSTKLTCLLLPSSPSPARRRNWRTRYVCRPRNRAKSRPQRCFRAVALSRARARARAPRPRAFPTPRHSLVFAFATLVADRRSIPLFASPNRARWSSARVSEQGQGEEAREAPLDADRDHGRGGAGETREEGGEESGEGACIPHPTRRLPSQHETRASDFRRFLLSLFLFFRTTLLSREFVSLREKVDKVHANAFFKSARGATSPLPYVSPSPLVANSQEAKAEARKERLDFELNGPNKQMTKKERRRLEAEGLNRCATLYAIQDPGPNRDLFCATSSSSASTL